MQIRFVYLELSIISKRFYKILALIKYITKNILLYIAYIQIEENLLFLKLIF